MHRTKPFNQRLYQCVFSLAKTSLLLLICMLGHSFSANANSLSQAKRMHDRLVGVPPSEPVLQEMRALIEAGDPLAAASIAMQNPSFYNITLKHWISPWTNEEGDIFAPLNDYSATVIGIIRDDLDFRLILSGDLIYTGATAGVPSYAVDNNDHYAALEQRGIDLSTALIQNTQSALLGLPPEATAGVMTTRAGAKAFFKDGTNRAMLRFTLINHLCTDLEALKDTSLPPDRIRQDLSRSPGGDSRIFANSCAGCHSGMDPLAQAFAYYEYNYDVDSDPQGENGRLQYNRTGENDPDTGTRVTKKHRINANNFPFGYVIEDDRWDNYWRQGINQTLGWSTQLQGYGYGAKSMGEELANSQKFAHCQVSKVFENICLRPAQDAADWQLIDEVSRQFMQSGYLMKPVFAATANYCKGE
ncbi:hypothetical protein [Agaribacter flavus]|uniref:DUF1585 domain-containing protein n=1 Tax=Agaribacter flavus TaxID=1902781 RepID=A0ABV7FMU4_9ALTE